MGYILLVPAVVLLVVRFYYGIKLAVFDTKVFAFCSVFLQKKVCTVIKNNVMDEIGGVLMIVALACIVFSREKKETQIIGQIRLRTLILASYANAVFMLGSLIFFYGFAYIYMLVAGIVSWYIFYILIFTFFKLRIGQGNNATYTESGGIRE